MGSLRHGYCLSWIGLILMLLVEAPKMNQMRALALVLSCVLTVVHSYAQRRWAALLQDLIRNGVCLDVCSDVLWPLMLMSGSHMGSGAIGV